MSQDTSAITDPFDTTALDEATELRALAQALRLAQGFKLIFVRCNQLQQRQKLVADLRNELPELKPQEIHFKEPITHLLDELRGRISEPAPDAVFVSGLEYSLPTAAEADSAPLIANLNASRNSFPQAVPCPLVLWVPEYVLNAIVHGAPDFFSIRSGVYFFAAAPSDTLEAFNSLTAGAEWVAMGLSLTEKQERIEAIKSLLADYESLPADQRNYQTEMRLYYRLGNLYFAIGNLSLAQTCCQQQLALARKLEDRDGEASALNGLGEIYRNQARLTEAEDAYQQALVISRDLDNRSGEGAVLANLGATYQMQGRLDEAEKFYQDGLIILRETKNRANEGKILANLSVVYKNQNRLAEAEDICKQGLLISREVNDSDGEMNALVELGNIYFKQGRITEAIESYRQSLMIARQLGDLLYESGILHNLGRVYSQQVDLPKAEQAYNESLLIREKIGDHIGQGTVLRDLACVSLLKGDVESALEFTQQAIEVLKSTDDVQELAQAQELLASLQQKGVEQ